MKKQITNFSSHLLLISVKINNISCKDDNSWYELLIKLKHDKKVTNFNWTQTDPDDKTIKLHYIFFKWVRLSLSILNMIIKRLCQPVFNVTHMTHLND